MAEATNLGFEFLPYSPDSLDLASSGFFLFPQLKTYLHGYHFGNNGGFLWAVEEILEDRDSSCFRNGIATRVHRWCQGMLYWKQTKNCLFFYNSLKMKLKPFWMILIDRPKEKSRLLTRFSKRKKVTKETEIIEEEWERKRRKIIERKGERKKEEKMWNWNNEN